jgi:hypothetical protein
LQAAFSGALSCPLLFFIRLRSLEIRPRRAGFSRPWARLAHDKRFLGGRQLTLALSKTKPFLGGRQMTLARPARRGLTEGHTPSPISLSINSSSTSLLFSTNYHPYSWPSSTQATRSHSQISSHKVFGSDCISPLPSTPPSSSHLLSPPALSSTNLCFNTHLTLFPLIAPRCDTFSQTRTAKNHVFSNTGHSMEEQRDQEK